MFYLPLGRNHMQAHKKSGDGDYKVVRWCGYSTEAMGTISSSGEEKWNWKYFKAEQMYWVEKSLLSRNPNNYKEVSKTANAFLRDVMNLEKS